MDSPKRKRSSSTSSSSIQKAPLRLPPSETDTDTDTDTVRSTAADNHIHTHIHTHAHTGTGTGAHDKDRDRLNTVTSAVTMTQSPSGSLSKHPKVSETSSASTSSTAAATPTTFPATAQHSTEYSHSSVTSTVNSDHNKNNVTATQPNDNTQMSDTTNSATTNNNNSSSSSEQQQPSQSQSQSQSQSEAEWVTIEAQSCRGVYGLGISAVAPRPIAVITSKSSNGDLNCAPFSYTGLLSHDPPMVAHGLCLSRTGRKKDTLINIEQTERWVYNVLSDHWIHEANACSEEFDRHVNELDMVGLDTIPCDMSSTTSTSTSATATTSTSLSIPRIKQALVSMECVLESKKEIYNDDGRHTTTVVFGKIVKYHIHKSVLGGTLDKPVVQLEQIRLCGRVGDITYWPAGTGKALPLKRP